MRALSPQQTLVMTMLCTSLPHKEIREKIGMADGTYRQHVRRIYRNLEVHNRIQAIQAWESRNLSRD